jgi:ribosomal protein L3 glutamine methyltransferase
MTKNNTLKQLVIAIYEKFEKADLYYGHGTDNAWDEAIALVFELLGIPFNSDKINENMIVSDQDVLKIFELANKRIEEKIPLPYLTKTAYFMGLPFYVDERVLIPRSPISELIANQFSPWIKESNVKSILDLCTGSGCIAIACAKAFPNSKVDATDLSKDALDVAKINVKKHFCENQITLIYSDVFENVPEKQYDIIVSNPPYVSDSEISILPKEYFHEPIFALQAEDDGLLIVKNIINNASRFLSDNGILVVETNSDIEKLENHYQNLPFIWLEFENGGDGIFLLTKKDLVNVNS